MFFWYSVIYTIGFLVLLPRFLFDALFKGKYAAGFRQRLGFLPPFVTKGKGAIWLHCVSVGEVNAARPLADRLRQEFADRPLVVSTTTRAGQKLARTAFADSADLVFYFPFDWRSTVRRALRHIRPSAVLLMETEIWFNFIRESYHAGARLAIVNGRLSQKSLDRYTKIKKFMKRVLGYLDLALMQTKGDATRLMELGLRASKARVTGNLKFDLELNAPETALTEAFRSRFGITPDVPLILAASTHAPEESWLLDAFKEVWRSSTNGLPRLMIAPRHPERFNEVAELIKKTGFTWARRSAGESSGDASAEVILLDSIGELRSCYGLAEVVFVGGSLIPHGGQSIFEPAAAGGAIVTGPYTANFAAAVKEFLERDALVQLPRTGKKQIVGSLTHTFRDVLTDRDRRAALGANSLSVMETNRGAVDRTIEYLAPMLGTQHNR
jgi:3-deoxy-D-manno-octulosonic-acid transferase